MITSIHERRIEFASSLHGSVNDAVDPVVVRDGYINGLLHMMDEHARVHVNVIFPDQKTGTYAEYGSPTVDVAAEQNYPAEDQWALVGPTPLGPFPLTRHVDGKPYVLRVRIAGICALDELASELATTFAVVVAPTYEIAVGKITEAADSVFHATTSSRTVAWLTGATQGSGAYTERLEVDASDAAAWTRRVSVYDAVSSGSPATIEQCLVYAWVFVSFTGAEAGENATDYPRLYGLHLAEYTGDE